MQLDRKGAPVPRMCPSFVERSGANFVVGPRGGNRKVPHQLVVLHALKAGKISLFGPRFTYPANFVTCLGLRIRKADDFPNFELGADLDDHGTATADVHGVDIFVEWFSRRVGAEDSNWNTNRFTGLSTGHHNRTRSLQSNF